MLNCGFFDEAKQIFSCSFPLGIALYDVINEVKISITNTPYKSIDYISNISDSNLVALVYRGSKEVQVWDRCINSHLLTFIKDSKSKITGIRLRPDALFIITADSICAYNLFDQSQFLLMKTFNNYSGTFDIASPYSSEVIAIPTNSPGCFSFYNYLNIEKPLAEVKAFNKPLRILKFSRRGRLLAASSDDGHRVKIFQVPTGILLITLTLSQMAHKIATIIFDDHSNQLIAQTETNTLNLFNLPVLDAAVSDPETIIRPVCSYPLGKGQFWPCFGLELYDIVVVSNSNKIIKLRYNKKTKDIDFVKEVQISR